jgi:hypothetical protein
MTPLGWSPCSAFENHAVLTSLLAVKHDHVGDLRTYEWISMCIAMAVDSLQIVATKDQHSHFFR